MTSGSNSNQNHQEDGGAMNNNNNPGTRSWGTGASGQSVSTSGSVGSPSSRSELVTMATPASDSTFLRLNNLDIQGDDAGSQGAVGGKKKKRGQRAVGPDKSGRGLRQFSMKVCEKVESKGRTTYNEVADELVAEFGDPGNTGTSPDQQQQYDEKNIRRRVYDALNVLMAMDIISKDKKEIQWKGLPRTSISDIEELKNERLTLRNRIDKKAAYLQELEEQYVGLQSLIRRNEQLYSSGNAPSGGVALPFILVQTRPHATVEVEISEDMQLVHFDFNSTPFELHDDNFVLKSMKFNERPPPSNDQMAHNVPSENAIQGHGSIPQPQIIPTPRANAASTSTSSPPLIPGIIKAARVKPEL
ncbi:PREDICTED: transcription factor-like protein DPB isoform X1 [Tarenaya hassleriana]|uniref:transcription factor-like protein DPB isoform X1 n=1 Tax=Tarenaya hassleriana TaxID=28532 RepID=UPI00053C92E3|nr:PREDICTED: transcription factor-like protein DPB isoform X1 [Tarenaya hassleriana]XP_010543415.1 PREDICTED: transcription factor-like protein DPB isoform X1 [Tarenaya hassleriana]XP_010543416.1 PREDICTED: transcription factor-like protein DPB isoform X1 [Tarenaya hassleriana]XP_010543417.1 PREDICTED: transcription factor-like protein DPB isoform X1 [Tarenaya hassleriana]XP_010543418.1 PREDICTED: transcription factor-like protein DPB isoform X1 [Tarenaya hassleriana]XP_010543419.1 PREDICTED: